MLAEQPRPQTELLVLFRFSNRWMAIPASLRPLYLIMITRAILEILRALFRKQYIWTLISFISFCISVTRNSATLCNYINNSLLRNTWLNSKNWTRILRSISELSILNKDIKIFNLNKFYFRLDCFYTFCFHFL